MVNERDDVDNYEEDIKMSRDVGQAKLERGHGRNDADCRIGGVSFRNKALIGCRSWYSE